MNRSRTLLLSILLCALFHGVPSRCAATTTATTTAIDVTTAAVPSDQGELLAPGDSYEERKERNEEIAGSLHRFTRTVQTNFSDTGILGQLVSKLTTLPTNAIGEIVRVASDILARIRSIVRVFFEIAESTIVELRRRLNVETEPSRRRRSSLLEMSDLITTALPNLLQYPLDYLHRSIDTAQSIASGQIERIVNNAVTATWHFLSTEGLPWLHRTLDQLEKSPDLPSGLNGLIQNFDTVYSILRMLGYIDPSTN